MLFKRLEVSGVGCYLNGVYAGALGYADDLAIIAPSKRQLEKMLTICSDFAKSYQLIFNPNKTVYTGFGHNVDREKDRNICFDGVNIPNTTRARHLGHIITAPFGKIDSSVRSK